MGKFHPGDKVSVDGEVVTILSWPESDSGPFFAERREGDALHQYNFHTHINTIGKPIGNFVEPVLVEKGPGEVVSTAGDVPDVDAEVVS